MQINKEADFVLKGDKIVYPPVRTDGLELYYDTKGKKNTDTYKNKLLDMSGNGLHGELHNFNYKNLSGYQEDSELVFDGIDDTLKMSKLNGIDADNFTYQLNNNILAFTGDEVKTVKNGNLEVGGRNLFAISELPAWWSQMEKSGNKLTFKNYYANGTPIRIGSILEVGKEYTISFKVKRLSGTAPRSISGSICFYDPLGDSLFRKFGGGGAETISETFVLDSIRERDVIYIYGSTTGVYEFKDIKIEKGNKATVWTPAPEDLLETTELKGNILGDMEDIVDASPRDNQSGKEVFTEHADDSHVEVEVDGKSYQHAGSGKNLFSRFNNLDEFMNMNIFVGAKTTKDDIGVSFENNQIKIPTWDGVSSESFDVSVNFGNLKPNTKYVFSLNSNVTHDRRIYSFLGDSLFLEVGRSNMLFTTNENGECRDGFVTMSDGRVVNDKGRIHMGRNQSASSTHFNNPMEVILSNFQLEEGSTATEYEPPAPSPDYPVEVESVNDFDVVSDVGRRNFILNSDVSRETEGITWLDVSKDLTPELVNKYGITLSVGTEVENTKLVEGSYNRIGFELNTTTRAGRAAYRQVDIRPEDGETFKGRIYRYHRLGDVERIHRVAMWIQTGGDKTYVANPKISLGDTGIDWTPAPEDITQDTNHPLIDKINLNLGEPLRSVGDVKDRLFKDNDGLWKVERNVGETFFDGSELWSYQESSHHFYRGFSDKQPGQSPVASNIASGRWVGKSLPGEDNEVYSFNNTNIGFRIDSITYSDEFQNAIKSIGGIVVHYELKTPTIEILGQEFQDKLNTLKSFKDSNYIYTVQNMDNPHKEQLKPTLHATFNSKDYLKETRTLTNLLIWARELTDEELIHHNQLFLNRFNLPSDRVIGEPIEQTLSLLYGRVVGHSLEQNYTINI